ncbi:uncharacterized protein [Triticum aestivum]|uniref:uncharacterized protein n=1 Tax=Triticum aestivum TaxID=4565 RepID=UPI001D026D1B|nr:uncharacterized protein LOC123168041 [Triticum aestivum]
MLFEFLLDAVDRFPLREEFTGSFEHSDPVPLVLLRNSEADHAVPVDSNPGSGCGQQSAATARWDGFRQRPDASPTRSAQSTARVNREAPGWTKSAWTLDGTD